MKKLALSLGLVFLASLPVAAATQRSADFKLGQSVGLGLFGLSYDYGWGPLSFGAQVVNNHNYLLRSAPHSNTFLLGSRLLYRLNQDQGLSTALIGGLSMEPGQAGDKIKFIPELGFSAAYSFRDILGWPLAVRLNVTLASREARTGQRIHFFQTLGIGPSTNLEIAYAPLDNFEVTLGGNTLLGTRFMF